MEGRLIDMLEKLISKAEESMERALHHANKTDGNKTTNILNAEYHMGEFHAYMELIEEISLDKYVEIGESWADSDTFAIVHDGKLFITDECAIEDGEGNTI